MFAMTYGDYFRAMGIPLLDGRYFTPDDRSNAPLVVIVNQSMAKHCWPGQRAIGKRMHVGNPHKGLPWATVVGIVADTTVGSRDEPGDRSVVFPGAAARHSLRLCSLQESSPAPPADTSPSVRPCLPSR